MSCDAETNMMVQLRDRLKLDQRTKTATLAAAVALTSDLSLQPSQVCKTYGLVGAHSRVKKLADQIRETGLLTAGSMVAVQLPPPQPQASAPRQQLASGPNVGGLRSDLLVTQQWISAKAPAIELVEAGGLVVDGSRAIRSLRVKLRDGAGEAQVHVQYDMPALGTDRDAQRQMELMHRRREERAPLAVDSEAAAVVRERKTAQQRVDRKRQAEIREVLNYIISRL